MNLLILSKRAVPCLWALPLSISFLVLSGLICSQSASGQAESVVQASEPEQVKEATPTCKRLWRHPRILEDQPTVQVPNAQSVSRRAFAVKVQSLLKKQNWREFYDLFHPALKEQMTQKRFRVRMGNLVKIYGKRPQVTNFRSWEVKGTGGDPDPVFCENSNLHLFPTYGFDPQLSLWFQILGNKDVGRYFVQAGVKDGEWTLTLVHVHQWTHLGIDGPKWVQLGFAEKDPILKYLYLDLGFKLAMSNPHVVWPGRESLKQDVLSAKKSANLEKVVSAFSSQKIRDVSSAFSRKGLGLTVYLEFDKETSKSGRKAACRSLVDAMQEKRAQKEKSGVFWMQETKGVQCVFMYPRHKELRPNKLGTYQLSFKKPKAKVEPKAELEDEKTKLKSKKTKQKIEKKK